MKKFMSLCADGEFFIVLHAAPDQDGKFQWFFSDDFDALYRININGQVYESIVLSSEDIREHYMDKFIGCDIDDEQNAIENVYLTDSFVDMIRDNQFDIIDFFDDDGYIRDDISYKGLRSC